MREEWLVVRTLPPRGGFNKWPDGRIFHPNVQVKNTRQREKHKWEKIEIKRNDEKKSDITYTSYKTGQLNKREKKDYYHVFCKCWLIQQVAETHSWITLRRLRLDL